ncbi:MAG TPA: universal stress protein, partial [Actinomycetota bacterium]
MSADQMTADRPFSLVLAGVGGSERSVEAARQAARLASAARAQLIVAYVIEHRPYEEGDAERALDAASAAARAAGADPEARVVT